MVTREDNKNITLERLDKIISLLEHLLAYQLYRSGVNQETIAKHLQMSKTSINKLLKGIKREYLKGTDEKT